jgi:hypothetical protein
MGSIITISTASVNISLRVVRTSRQMRFEFRHLATNGGQQHAKLAASSRKAPGFNRRYQDRHRFKAIHHPSTD